MVLQSITMAMVFVFQMTEANIALWVGAWRGVVHLESLEHKPAVASVAGILSLPDRPKVEFIKNNHAQPSAKLEFISYLPSQGLHFDF